MGAVQGAVELVAPVPSAPRPRYPGAVAVAAALGALRELLELLGDVRRVAAARDLELGDQLLATPWALAIWCG